VIIRFQGFDGFLAIYAALWWERPSQWLDQFYDQPSRNDWCSAGYQRVVQEETQMKFIL